MSKNAEIIKAIQVLQEALNDFGGGTIHITEEDASLDDNDDGVIVDEGSPNQVAEALTA